VNIVQEIASNVAKSIGTNSLKTEE